MTGACESPWHREECWLETREEVAVGGSCLTQTNQRRACSSRMRTTDERSVPGQQQQRRQQQGGGKFSRRFAEQQYKVGGQKALNKVRHGQRVDVCWRFNLISFWKAVYAP